jgi:hypothetical protein
LNRISEAIPASWWLRPGLLTMMTAVARFALASGQLRLTGRTPSGSQFIANPKRIWTITSSRAIYEGRDLGPMEPSGERAALGDFVIPRRPLFAAGAAFMVEAPSAV